MTIFSHDWKTIAISLRSNLHVLEEFSDTCKDESNLVLISHKIQEVVDEVCSLITKKDGLALRQSPIKRQKLCQTAHGRPSVRPLPLRKSSKWKTLFEKYKGQVVKKADQVREAAALSVDLDMSKAASCNKQPLKSHRSEHKRRKLKIISILKKQQRKPSNLNKHKKDQLMSKLLTFHIVCIPIQEAHHDW